MFLYLYYLHIFMNFVCWAFFLYESCYFVELNANALSFIASESPVVGRRVFWNTAELQLLSAVMFAARIRRTQSLSGFPDALMSVPEWRWEPVYTMAEMSQNLCSFSVGKIPTPSEYVSSSCPLPTPWHSRDKRQMAQRPCPIRICSVHSPHLHSIPCFCLTRSGSICALTSSTWMSPRHLKLRKPPGQALDAHILLHSTLPSRLYLSN